MNAKGLKEFRERVDKLREDGIAGAMFDVADIAWLLQQHGRATEFVVGMVGPNYQPRSHELRELLQLWREGEKETT